MHKSTKSFLNFIFLFFSTAGLGLILFNDRIEYHLAVFIPMSVIFIYGVMVSGIIGSCRNYSQASRRTDTIYYMGFLYTLMSLGAFFYRIKQLPGAVPDQLVMAIAFTYLVIALSTSIGGIIAGRMVLSGYVRNRRDEDGRELFINRISGF